MKYKITKQAWMEIGKMSGWLEETAGFMGIPDDVNLNINYDVGERPQLCPKCGKEIHAKPEKKTQSKCPSCGAKLKK